MKKLTAGIFATILGVTAMGAADAAVTSKGYVDAALATKANASEVSTLSSTVAGHTTQITNLQTADTTLQNNINTLAQNTTTSLNLKADKAEVGTLPADTSATTVVEYVDLKTSGIASSDTVNNLTTRVEAIEGDYITSTELENSQSAQNTAITTAYQTADAATLKAAQDYADANDADTVYDDTQVKADILANTQAIDAIEADYLKANDIANLATKSEVETATNDMATRTWVGEQNYATENFVTTQGYLKSADLATYATQEYANTAATTAANGKDAAIAEARKAGTDAATAAATAQDTADDAAAAAAAAQATANAAIKAPAACSDPTNMCVLVSDGTTVSWQVIANVYPNNN